LRKIFEELEIDDDLYIDMMEFLDGYKSELYEINNLEILGIDSNDIYRIVKLDDGRLFIFKFCKRMDYYI